MTKRVLALITLTILAAGTIQFYNSSTAADKFAAVTTISNSNVFAPTPTANQLYPTNDLVNSRAWYQVIFTTGTTAPIKQVEVDFPPGTNVANAKLVDTAGLGPGTFTISGQTITYTVAPEVLVPANTELRLQYDNILNPSIPDANLTVRITTKDPAGSVIDSGTSLAYKIRQIGTEDISNKSITREKIKPGAVVAVVTQRSSEIIPIPPGQDQLAVAVCKAGEVTSGGGYKHSKSYCYFLLYRRRWKVMGYPSS